MPEDELTSLYRLTRSIAKFKLPPGKTERVFPSLRSTFLFFFWLVHAENSYCCSLTLSSLTLQFRLYRLIGCFYIVRYIDFIPDLYVPTFVSCHTNLLRQILWSNYYYYRSFHNFVWYVSL